jgi:hypothetical protein
MKKNLFGKWGFGRLVAVAVFTVSMVFVGCDSAVGGGVDPAGLKDGARSAASSAGVNLAPGSDSFSATHLDTLGNNYCYFTTYYPGSGYAYHDFYTFDTTNGNYLIYDMSTYTPYSDSVVSGEIQYIHHFGDNIPITITDVFGVEHDFDGAAGVLIVELDHGLGDGDWVYTGSGDFTAVYYYDGKPIPDDDEDGILTSVQNGVDPEDYTLTSVQLGFAAEPNPDSPPLYATPCFATLAEAIAAFDSIGSLKTYILEPPEFAYEKTDLEDLP